jgi:16S rRNA (cytidine1402-2'-O)-methyltransferase
MLSELVEENRTGVFYEAPHRLLKSLTDFRDIWGENRRVSVARELTKQFEEVRRGTFGEMVTYFTANPPRGELTLVTDGKVYGEERIPGDPAVIRSAVEALMKAGAGPQTACKMVAKALGLAKGQVYRIYHRV